MRRLLASLAVPLLLAVPACGEDKKAEASPQQIVLQSVGKTAEAKTAKVSMKMKMVAAETMDITADGALDIAGKKARLSMSMPGMEALFGGGKVEIIQHGLVMYMKLPANDEMPAELKAKPWLKMDLQALGEQQGMDLGALTQMGGSNDPTASLDYLRGVSEDVQEVGEEDVRGEGTTRYKGNVDIEKAIAQTPADAQASVRDFLGKLGVKTFPFEVWIDDEGRTRRMRTSIDMSAATDPDIKESGIKSMDIEMELYEFGTTVDAEAPPANETTDFAALLQSIGAGMGEN